MAYRIKKSKKISYGFTLLELLVSITILSLIITISYSALRLGTKSWDASINNINNNTATRSAIDLIKNKLEHIYPIYWKKDTRRALAFQGDEERIMFIAPSPQGREVGEYFEYMLVVNKSQNGTSMELFYEPHSPGDDEFSVDEESPYREILTGLKDARFSFYGKPENNAEEEWFVEWKDEFISLPSAVQVVMVAKEGAGINREFIIQLQSELSQF